MLIIFFISNLSFASSNTDTFTFLLELQLFNFISNTIFMLVKETFKRILNLLDYS